MGRYIGIAVIAVVAAYAMYQLIGTDVPEQSEKETIILTEPDVFGEDVLFNQLRADGSLHYRLRASAIRQFNSDELTRMTTPELHLTNIKQPPWDIGSRHGYIRSRTNPEGNPEEVVYLRDTVKMVQEHPVNGQITLRSESFYIYPDRQYAETDQDVMIDTEVGRTTAAGMRADLKTGTLNLSSSSSQRVHTIVLPEQFKNS